MARAVQGDGLGEAEGEGSPIRYLVVDPVTGIGERVSRLLRTRTEFEAVDARPSDEDPAVPAAGVAAAIRRHRPEVVFLAASAATFDGFQVLETVPDGSPPAVVLLADTDEYAGRAFDIGAVDYLTLPCSPRRLWEAVERVRRRLDREPARPPATSGGAADGGEGWEDGNGGGRVSDRYLTVKEGDAYKLVDLAGLRWAEAARNYVRLHTEEGNYLVRTSLRRLEERLDGPHFVRIHRSALVNVRRIRRIVPLQWGDCRVELDDGEELRMSRTYRENLL